MALATQQTELYVVDPDDDSILKVGGVSAISGIDSPVSAIDATTLGSDHKTFLPGISEPAAASFSILFDPKDATQMRLHELRAKRKVLDWCVGFSDGTAEPTAAVAPAEGFSQAAVARTFIYFPGFVTSWPLAAGINEVMTAQVGIQLTNTPVLVAATAP